MFTKVLLDVNVLLRKYLTVVKPSPPALKTGRTSVSAAGAGERADAPQEAAGGAGGPETSLPSNRAESRGPAGPKGAGRHQE